MILVDDGSTDNCPQICDEYEKNNSNIKVLHLENGVPARARNKGIEIATGEYIGFADSDDYFIRSNLKSYIKMQKIIIATLLCVVFLLIV